MRGSAMLPEAWRSSRRRLVAVTLFGAVVLVAVLFHQVWWSKPTVFGGSSHSQMRPTLKVGQTLNVDMISRPYDEEVVLHGVKPLRLADGTDAEVEFVVCDYSGEVQMGASTGSLDDQCSSVSPVEGHRFGLDPDESIIARITPRKPGVTAIDGAVVSYSRGWRHLRQTGSEPFGIRVAITVRDSQDVE